MLKLSFENEYAVISLSKSDCSIGMVRFFFARKMDCVDHIEKNANSF